MQKPSNQVDIAFRVDSSPIMGVGHVMRCLTLANAFSNRGFICEFVCRSFDNNYSNFIQDHGYKVNFLTLKTDSTQTKDTSTWLGVSQLVDAEESIKIYPKNGRPKLFIVDHYAISKEWESAISDYGINILVIDDLEDREHKCNVLIDSTFNRTMDHYDELCGHTAKLLLGSDYCMLKPEFKSLRSQALTKRKKNQSIESILINFGGSDPDKLTLQALKALKDEGYDGDISIIITSACEWLNELVETVVDYDNCQLYVDSKIVHELMLQADLAIGSTGTSTWERCCLGLPSITIVAAKNQLNISESLSRKGALISVQKHKLKESIKDRLETKQDFFWWHEMSDKAFSICDGSGVDRIVNEVESLL